MSILRIFLLVLLTIFVTGKATSAQAQTNVLFIVDASGSMKKQVGAEPRMGVAKKVLGETLAAMPADAQLGLMLYGHRKAKDCKDIELVAPIGGEDAASLSKTIADLKPIGETPIAESLKKAAKSFKAFKGQQNSIILVTDGKEECQGDPCAAAKELKDSGLDVVVNIVGFTLTEEEGKALQCVTEATGGKYYAAADAAGLTDALKQVQTKVQETVIVQTAKAPEFNGDILAAKNGGTLVYAPSEKWSWLNKNHNDFISKHRPTYGGEAVWSFKDSKAATFDQIEVLVQEANQYNLKTFEVLAGDEVGGSFRSLGEFTVQNVKMMPEGWQGFKFPETTARYVKVIFKDSYGSYIGGNALRLMGTIDETSEGAAVKRKVEGIDVLAEENGATLVHAPNDAWERLNRDHENFKGPTYQGEGVWSFKDGKPAKFSQIDVLVPEENKYNLKSFEVLSSDKLDGPYKSLGKFTAMNTKVMPDGWQSFTLPETTAYFVKVVFKDSYDSYISGNAIRLIGTIDESATALEAPKAPEGSDLIGASKGGSFLFGPDEAEWGKLNKEKSERAVVRIGEGVWAFRDEKPAIIEAVRIFVPNADQYNLKDFEVLVGDEGPTGSFRSLGKFTVQNAKIMPDGWQVFTFPKTEAKYVKLSTINAQGDSYIAMYGFEVIGTLMDE